VPFTETTENTAFVATRKVVSGTEFTLCSWLQVQSNQRALHPEPFVLVVLPQWQALPKDLPPKSTVWAYFDLWTWDGRD
jgi:hypothetical protein